MIENTNTRQDQLPTKSHVKEAKRLGINLATLAAVLHKDMQDLTAEDLQNAINAKKMK